MVVQNRNIVEQRNLIVNWLTLIHTKYGFQPETLHEATNIFNRYLSRINLAEG